MVWSRMMMRLWNSAFVAVHATLRRISQNVLASELAGRGVILNLPAAFAHALVAAP
jgi:hypothetical protein